MYPRGAILAALLAVLFLLAASGAALAEGPTLAQPAGGQGDSNEDTGDVEEGETESGENTDEEGSSDTEVPGGQGDAEAESGAQEDSEAAVTETGPPWTYQMARISLVLLVLLGLAVFRSYHKLVGSRQKGAA